MKAAPFSYHRPASVAEAISILRREDNARILAGGQSLMPMLAMRLATVEHLVDINRIPELTQITFSDTSVKIGAMVRQAHLLEHADIGRRLPILHEALHEVGHLPTRTRGTIGGSICHLDPSAELPGVAALHDAVLTIAGPNGTRRLGMSEFALDFLTPDLRPGEMLTDIEFPLWSESHGFAFVEHALRHGDFAVVGVGALLELGGDASIRRAAIVLTGMGSKPIRLIEAERALEGARPGVETWPTAGEHARALEPLSDHMASASYRKRLAFHLTQRALARAAERIGQSRSVKRP